MNCQYFHVVCVVEAFYILLRSPIFIFQTLYYLGYNLVVTLIGKVGTHVSCSM